MPVVGLPCRRARWRAPATGSWTSGRRRPRRPLPDGADEDLGDAILIPGLVDAHCHLEWSLLDGVLPPSGFGAWLARLLPLRARMTPEDHRIAARHGALRALRAGTTTLADSGPTGAGAAAMAELGLAGRCTWRRSARRRARTPAARRRPWPSARRGARRRRRPRRSAWGCRPTRRTPSARPSGGRSSRSPPSPAGRGPRTSPSPRTRSGSSPAARARWPRPSPAPASPPGRWDGADGETTVAAVARRRGLRAGLVAAHCVRWLRGRPGDPARCGRERGPLPALQRAPPLRPGAARGAPRGRLALGLGTDSPASGGDYDVRAEARPAHRAPAARTSRPRSSLAGDRSGGAEALGLAARSAASRRGGAPTWSPCGRPGLWTSPTGPPWTPRRGRVLVVASGEVRPERRQPRGGRRGSTGLAEARERPLVASRAVLLDQKRTRRTVQVVAILTSLAFARVIFVVLGLIFFGGGGQSAEDQILEDARARVEASRTTRRRTRSWRPPTRPSRSTPRRSRPPSGPWPRPRRPRARAGARLAEAGLGDAAGAVASLQQYTAQNPRDAEAFLELGQRAEQAAAPAGALLLRDLPALPAAGRPQRQAVRSA